MQVHTFIADSANEAVERIRAELGTSAVVLSVRKLPRNGLDRFLKHDQIEVLARVEEPAEPAPVLTDPLTELREEIRQLRQQVAANSEGGRASSRAGGGTSRAAERQIPISVQSSTSPNRPDFKGTPDPAADRKPAGIAHLLGQTGLLPAYAEYIAQEIPSAEAISEQIERASDLLRRRWRGEPHRTEAAVHVFVGVPGSGKSTVLCKMLAQSALVEGQPATVYQLDSHIANVSSLPSVYAEIVGAQFVRCIPMQFERREESVYIDLPGVALHNSRALEQLKDLIASFGVPEVHLVLNGAYESAHLLEQTRFFSSLGITDLIVSHLDEETRWGKIWNLLFGTNYSVRSFACGQNIPGEFHPANPDLILARQFRGK